MNGRAQRQSAQHTLPRSMNNLSAELLVWIFGFVPQRQLWRLRRVSSIWRALIDGVATLKEPRVVALPGPPHAAGHAATLEVHGLAALATAAEQLGPHLLKQVITFVYRATEAGASAPCETRDGNMQLALRSLSPVVVSIDGAGVVTRSMAFAAVLISSDKTVFVDICVRDCRVPPFSVATVAMAAPHLEVLGLRLETAEQYREVLSAQPKMLPSLRVFCLASCDDGSHLPEMLSALGRAARNVEHVHVKVTSHGRLPARAHGGTLTPDEHATSSLLAETLIAEFPHLKRLAIDGPRMTVQDALRVAAGMPRLTHLAVRVGPRARAEAPTTFTDADVGGWLRLEVLVLDGLWAVPGAAEQATRAIALAQSPILLLASWAQLWCEPPTMRGGGGSGSRRGARRISPPQLTHRRW